MLSGIFCKLVLNYFLIFKKLMKNSLYVVNRMCFYLQQQFCEAGENCVTPAIFFCV